MQLINGENYESSDSTEDLDFFWKEEELNRLAKMWHEGMSVMSIAEHYKRDPDEVVLALLHLAKEEKIKKRKGGLFANFKE